MVWQYLRSAAIDRRFLARRNGLFATLYGWSSPPDKKRQ
jgi:hypothetical protein